MQGIEYSTYMYNLHDVHKTTDSSITEFYHTWEWEEDAVKRIMFHTQYFAGGMCT